MTSEPGRQSKCRRLDEVVNRISTMRKKKSEPVSPQPCLAGGQVPQSSSSDAITIAPLPLQDIPLDLSLKTDMLRRESAASAARERRSHSGAVVPETQTLALQEPLSPITEIFLDIVIDQVLSEADHPCLVCGTMLALHGHYD